MTSVVIATEKGRRKYITDDCSFTSDIGDAAIFTTPYDTAKLNSFLAYLSRNFGSCFTLLEVE